MEAISSQSNIYCTQSVIFRTKRAKGKCRCGNNVYSLHLTVVRGRAAVYQHEMRQNSVRLIRHEGQRSRDSQSVRLRRGNKRKEAVQFKGTKNVVAARGQERRDRERKQDRL